VEPGSVERDDAEEDAEVDVEDGEGMVEEFRLGRVACASPSVASAIGRVGRDAVAVAAAAAPVAAFARKWSDASPR
jgi:hypothetical protein